MSTGMARKPKLLMFISEDWYFWSHRRPLAIAALAAGFDVVLLTRIGDLKDAIEELGIRVVQLTLRRAGLNPVAEIRALAQVIRTYWRERPDVAHHVAMKPVIYGSIAARAANIPGVVNALAGLGYIFTSGSSRARRLKPVVKILLRAVLSRKNSVLILQNPDDFDLFLREGLVEKKDVRLVRGSGVDLKRFTPVARTTSENPVIMLCARMLWDKGIGEFVEAARRMRAKGASARFVLVGGVDNENPAGIPDTTLLAWQREGVVEWWGHRNDIPEVLQQATVFCLPSYREGFPKALLEAAACGLPLIATDVPGCREVVRSGDNGLLIAPRDAEAIVDAVDALLSTPAKALAMGVRAREIAVQEFSDDSVAAQTVDIYKSVCVEPVSSCPRSCGG